MAKNDYSAKRHFMRWNTWLSVVLACVLAGMLNHISIHYWWRADFSRARYFSLAPVTLALLENVQGPLKLTLLAAPTHELYRDLRGLLREYAHASDKVKIEFVDPYRDLARSKELVLRYDLTVPNQLLFEVQGRVGSVPLRELADYDYKSVLAGRPKSIVAFNGEHVITAAIHNLTRDHKPLIVFLEGHGEKNIENFDSMRGYSTIARLIRRNNFDLKTAKITSEGLPACDVLVIAGPTDSLTRIEAKQIKNFLNNSGRLFVLLDGGVDLGLDDLLAEWGIRVGDDRVVGPTLTGQELLLNDYGDHPITARLKDLTTIFNLPRSVQPLEVGMISKGRSRVTVLASTTGKGWADTSAYQDPPRFDPETDQPGPIAVAMAVEKGPADAIEMELKPARLVVFGDSTFVANAALTAGYNADLFLNAINWLAESEQVPIIMPRSPPTVSISLNRQQLNLLTILLAGALPLSIITIGSLVRWLRRK